MNDKYGAEQDPYCYPGTNTLKNLLNIRDEALLEVVEREITELEAQRQIMSPPPYVYSYLKSIHQALFSDIYECRIACRFKGKKGLILLDQIRAIDKSRLVKKLGIVSSKTQLKLCSGLQEMFEY
jgi:fido (protein-threonine AMPylation protein)